MSVLWSRVDDTLLYPPFLMRVRALVQEGSEKGVSFWVISGFRSYADQQRLYAQGRTKPGDKVTQANGGESAHNFGIAVDLCVDRLDRSGLQPDYKPDSYALLGDLAPKHGVIWGGGWSHPDFPHLNLPGFVTKDQMQPLREAFEAGGLLACWEKLDFMEWR